MVASTSLSTSASTLGSGYLVVFRGRCGDLIKAIWHDGQGAYLVC
jgi:hypothetical protein